MIQHCTGAGLPEPEFAVSDGFQTIIRWTLAPGQAPQPESLETRVLRVRDRGAGETREETREETRDKILALIAADPTITMNKLAEQIGITPKGIEWQIRRLREAGRLRRVGPTKGGRWEIIGDEDEHRRRA